MAGIMTATIKDPREVLGSILWEGESVVWTAKPTVRMIAYRRLVPTLFIIGWLAFAIWWAILPGSLQAACGVNPPRSCSKLYFISWPSAPILAAYLAQQTLRLVLQARGRLDLIYALTERRALSVGTGWFAKIKSVSLQTSEMKVRIVGFVDFVVEKKAVVRFEGLTDMQISEVEDMVLRLTLEKRGQK